MDEYVRRHGNSATYLLCYAFYDVINDADKWRVLVEAFASEDVDSVSRACPI